MADETGVRDDVKQFLEDTKDLPGECIACVTPKKISILVDDDNCALTFTGFEGENQQ